MVNNTHDDINGPSNKHPALRSSCLSSFASRQTFSSNRGDLHVHWLAIGKIVGKTSTRGRFLSLIIPFKSWKIDMREDGWILTRMIVGIRKIQCKKKLCNKTYSYIEILRILYLFLLTYWTTITYSNHNFIRVSKNSLNNFKSATE